MAEDLKKGVFITFEGPEGCGKSTHSSRLFKEMVSEGYEVVYTKEPGGTDLGGRIRDILLEKDDIKLDQESELFLFEADRAQHVKEVIIPALGTGKMIICDRFNTATFAYQGYGLGMDMDFIKKIDEKATGGIRPDLTILLDVDIRTGLERAGARSAADRMEKRSMEFHERVRDGYLAMAGKEPDRIKIVEVKEDTDQTYRIVRETVNDCIERYKRTA